MKAVTVTTIKKELQHLEKEQLVELALRVTKYKIENKELMTYLLFEEHDEDHFIETIKAEMDDQFEDINTASYHFIKKSVRKILRGVKKHVRYSKKIETEASGNIREHNIINYAKTGVQRISMGVLTHSISNFDFSLDIK